MRDPREVRSPLELAQDVVDGWANDGASLDHLVLAVASVIGGDRQRVHELIACFIGDEAGLADKVMK